MKSMTTATFYCYEREQAIFRYEEYSDSEARPKQDKQPHRTGSAS